ncbi:hypothetical protein [Streptomyces sp. NBC_01334]|uniref:hypothetical protein n=1 Tax=Streptomyces sp. NBC_01334 TaxID=2903827 RepID=UPI002E143167|nr:hypothetical protein OG736_40395 [Streptomyces sp. NBC_01334]
MIPAPRLGPTKPDSHSPSTTSAEPPAPGEIFPRGQRIPCSSRPLPSPGPDEAERIIVLAGRITALGGL